MDLKLDLTQFEFTCLGCGECCYRAVRSLKNGLKGFDYQGQYTYNPLTSVSVLYTEVPEFVKQMRARYPQLVIKLFPQEVLFLKEYPVGFTVTYQLGAKKHKYCHCYDVKTHRCKIYEIRPTVCRHYPIACKLLYPLLDKECLALLQEIKRQYPSMTQNDTIQTNIAQVINIFPKEYALHQIIQFYAVSLLLLLHNKLGFLLKEEGTLGPQKVSQYDLLDFSQFFDWVQGNVISARTKQICKEVLFEVKCLHSSMNKNLAILASNPEQITIPVFVNPSDIIKYEDK